MLSCSQVPGHATASSAVLLPRLGTSTDHSCMKAALSPLLNALILKALLRLKPRQSVPSLDLLQCSFLPLIRSECKLLFSKCMGRTDVHVTDVVSQSDRKQQEGALFLSFVAHLTVFMA